MTHTTRRRFGGLLTGGLVFGAGLGSRPARAQAWPSKPITYIVPFPPGGTSDLTARLIGQEIGKGLGQPVVVENRAGANGNIGSAAVAKAPPDGYTLLLSGVGSNAINHGLYPKLPYDSRKDFAHVTILTRGPNVLVANAGFPAKSMREFVELVKASPDKYNYASSGNGSSGHMAMELLKMTAGLQVDHIPYKGGAPALTDVIAGQVPFMFVNQDVVIPHIKAGKLHPLGVASLERLAIMPEVPTIAEQGFPGFEAVSWNAMSAPAGTPRPIIERLHAEVVRALRSPAVTERLVSNGFIPGGGSPEETAEFIGAEIEKWSAVAKRSGAKVD